MFDQIKNAILILLLIVVGLGTLQYINVWGDAQEKIKSANDKLGELQAANTELDQQIASLNLEQTRLDHVIEDKEQEIKVHLAKIDEIQLKLDTANRNTIATVNGQAIAKEFKESYGLEDFDNIKMIMAPASDPSFKEEVLQIPVDYVKKTITARARELACEDQKDQLTDTTQLRSDIVKLTNEKLDLEKEKTAAYANGYREAFDAYKEINRSYVELLKAPPRIDLAPKWFQVVGGLVGGALLCNI